MDIDQKMKLAAEIVDAEWEMFKAVPNIGGTAPCQENQPTFQANRMSQAAAWSTEALQSYQKDLQEAKIAGRNLATEKYGRMMESTSPQEYQRIKHLLPEIDSRLAELVEEIVSIELKRQEEIQAKYPHLLKRGRRLHSVQDSLFSASFETYLRAELQTYSYRTLLLYKENLLKLESENINGAEIALEYLVKTYGYQNAREANDKLAGG